MSVIPPPLVTLHQWKYELNAALNAWHLAPEPTFEAWQRIAVASENVRRLSPPR